MSASNSAENSQSGNRLNIKDKWYYETIQALGTLSGAISINPSLGGYITLDLSAAATITFNTASLPAGRVAAWTIKLTGGTNGVTWPAGTLFAGGVPPELTANVDYIICTYDGTHLTVSGLTDYQVVP